MTWAKLDDQIFYNPKMVRLDPPEKLAYFAGLAYASGQLTDGFIPCKAVPLLAAMSGINSIDTDALVDAGLWELADSGYQIHDYLLYNPSATEVKELRAANAKRQAEWRDKKFSNDSDNSVSNSVTNGVSASTPSPSPSPCLDQDQEDSVAKATGDEAPPTKKPPKESQPKKSESTEYEAVTVYRQITLLTPKPAIRQLITESVQDMERWRKAVIAWNAKGHNPKNIDGMLEWYRDGIPSAGPPKGNGKANEPHVPKGWKGIDEWDVLTGGKDAIKQGSL